MQKELFAKIEKGAYLSSCREYRFALWRIWDRKKPLVMFIGLNPSQANEEKDDPTIESVIRIAKFNDYGGIYMMNCWPHVATNPKELDCNSILNESNETFLRIISDLCQDVVFAWGNFRIVRDKARDKELQKMFPSALVIGYNKNRSPKHPLFQKGNSTLIPFTKG